MERKAHWYSVIQYCPNEFRGEKVNIGLVLHSPHDSKVLHSLLDETSQKVKGIALDEVSQRAFKAQKDVFDYYFKILTESQHIFSPDLTDNNFLKSLNKDIPKDFTLTEPTFSLTNNSEQLFETLIKTYIGEVPTSKEIFSTGLVKRNVKNYTKNIFMQHEWMGTKIKSNVKVHPIKSLKNMHFNVDFIFRNGVWNIIHTVPSNSTNERLTEWFSKTNTMVQNLNKETGFFVVFDTSDELNQDRTITDMVHFLTASDQRIKSAEIESDSFDRLCKKVEIEAKDLSEYEQELIAM